MIDADLRGVWTVRSRRIKFTLVKLRLIPFGDVDGFKLSRCD